MQWLLKKYKVDKYVHIREKLSLNNLNGYIGTNIKGWVVQMMGNLQFEFATLATSCLTSFMKVP